MRPKFPDAASPAGAVARPLYRSGRAVMTTKRRLAVGLLAVLLPTVLVSAAQAGMINVGTASNAANWLITGAGATNAPAFQVFGGDISLTSNAARTGTFIS